MGDSAMAAICRRGRGGGVQHGQGVDAEDCGHLAPKLQHAGLPAPRLARCRAAHHLPRQVRLAGHVCTAAGAGGACGILPEGQGWCRACMRECKRRCEAHPEQQPVAACGHAAGCHMLLRYSCTAARAPRTCRSPRPDQCGMMTGVPAGRPHRHNRGQGGLPWQGPLHDYAHTVARSEGLLAPAQARQQPRPSCTAACAPRAGVPQPAACRQARMAQHGARCAVRVQTPAAGQATGAAGCSRKPACRTGPARRLTALTAVSPYGVSALKQCSDLNGGNSLNRFLCCVAMFLLLWLYNCVMRFTMLPRALLTAGSVRSEARSGSCWARSCHTVPYKSKRIAQTMLSRPAMKIAQ